MMFRFLIIIALRAFMLSLPSAVRVLYKHLLSPAVITEHICKVVEKGGFWCILKTIPLRWTSEVKA